jgi:hypothetical protein
MKIDPSRLANTQRVRISRKQVNANQAKTKSTNLQGLDLSTVDGSILSQADRSVALQKGAGLMVGDYFVGFTTGTDLLFSQAVIVY